QRVQVESADHTDNSEENEDRNVSETRISVRVASEGVLHRSTDREQAEQQKSDHHERKAEDHDDQPKPAEERKRGGDQHGAVHGAGRDSSALHTARRPYPNGIVGAVLVSAEVVGEIAQDL